MRKLLLLLLCIFGLTLCYPQVKTVKVSVPSNVAVQKSDRHFVHVLDTTMTKYITFTYRDSTLYIGSKVEITEPIKIRIYTPDSICVKPGKNFKVYSR